MTVKEALDFGLHKLENAGVPDAAIDARLLMEFVLNVDSNYVLTQDGDELERGKLESYTALIDRRSERIPLQHLTGVQNFMGFDFKVNENVLIPRFDTEFLVEEALMEIYDGAKVLDLCTGSGCILLSVMALKNDIEGTGSDISEAALEVAKENAESLSLDPFFIKSDMFENISTSFDFILTNPPYIKSSVIPTLMEEVKDYDPRSALDGGEDGLFFYRIIAKEAKEHLLGGGYVFAEIGADQGDEVRALFEEAGYKNVEIMKDYSGNERLLKCLRN